MSIWPSFFWPDTPRLNHFPSNLKNQRCSKRTVAMHPTGSILVFVAEENANAGISICAWVAGEGSEGNAVEDGTFVLEIRKNVIFCN